MKQIKIIVMVSVMAALLDGCGKNRETNGAGENFEFLIERFADLKIMRYQVPGFDDLSLDQKKLIYYLSQAAISGRDVIYDQNGKYNLAIRRTLEAVYESYKGDLETQDFRNFEIYLKRIWFSNGIYHHYSSDKFNPGFSEDYFRELVSGSDKSLLPLRKGETVEELISVIAPVMFDPNVLPKKVSSNPESDLIKASAVNFYDNVNQEEATAFYDKIKDTSDTTPVSYGLNSRLVKEGGQLREEVYSLRGLYADAISEIIFWLQKASGVAGNEHQKKVIDTLIEYYKTGDLRTFDDYNILWVQDTSRIDFVNGFIETYEDPLGLKATWEALVNFKDTAATRRTEIISANAQWFEDNSPIDERFRKKEVRGVTAKVITAVMLGGDCYPATPIGINLPNSDWIRKDYGSKSVTIENITYAYDQAALNDGMLEEFASGPEEIELIKKYGYKADNLQVDLHECLGHGSGQLLPGTNPDALRNYASPLEEARADLFSLYYIADPKMEELGLIPNQDAVKAKYYAYIRNGLMTQLVRIEEGKDIEQAHMRCRQLISRWVYEHGKNDNVIEMFTQNGKTYYRINDFVKMRDLFGQLLAEVQRIKSEGDYEAGKELVETYGVHFDRDLHREVLERYAKLNISPYGGFVNPRFEVVEKQGEISDIKLHYDDTYTGQMMYYSKNYSFLPE
jgi:dipeptidyl-peptidase III